MEQALARGEPDTLSAFWDEVAATGAPLIEPAAGEDDAARELLITFLARDRDGVERVWLRSALMNDDEPANHFERLPGSDVWYLTLRLRDDLHTVYQIAIRDAQTPPEATGDELGAPDPLNPRRFAIPNDDEGNPDPGEYFSASEIRLPGAPQQPYLAPRPGVAAGSVEMVRLRSELLGNERRIWVYTPPDYTPDGEPYPLALLFDGFAVTTLIPSPTIADNLLAEGRVGPMVMIAIDSLEHETRVRELCCYQPFADFLARELLPWARARYHLTTDPARVVVAGQSAGGLAAAFVALRYPELFGAALAQSGAFWWAPEDDLQPDWLVRAYAEAPRLPLRFYLEAGALETLIEERTRGSSILSSSRRLRETLLAKGYPLTYAEFNGGHDYVRWRGTLADGLIALMGR
ncbi:MAG TPA: enterochelin esterase [Ktedonobacterales bacterium]